MTTDLVGLTSQVLALPPEQRFELAQKLWESVEAPPDDDETLFAEIERRDAEMERGTGQSYSHEEVMRDVKKVLGE